MMKSVFAAAHRSMRPLVVFALGMIVVANAATRLHGFPDRTLSTYWARSSAVQMAIGASFRRDPARAGRYHVPTHVAATQEMERTGKLPVVYPEVPAETKPEDWRPEYGTDIGYGVLLGLLWKGFGTNNVLLVIALQLVLDALVLVGLARVAHRLAGPAAAIATALTYSLFGPIVAQNGSPVVWPYYYFYPVVATGLAIAGISGIRFSKTLGRSLAIAVGTGLGLALIASIRSAAMIVGPTTVVLALLAARPTSADLRPSIPKKLLVALVLAGAFALGLVPLGARNQKEFGKPMLRRGTMWHSVVCGIGYVDSSSGFLYDDGDTIQKIKAKYPDAVYPEQSYEDACEKEARAFLDAHPNFHVKSAAALLGRSFTEPRTGPWWMPFNFLFPWGLIGWVFLAWRNRKHWPVVLAPWALWLSIAAPVAFVLMPADRDMYRMGSDTMLLLLACVGAGYAVRLPLRGLAMLLERRWVGAGWLPLIEDDAAPAPRPAPPPPAQPPAKKGQTGKLPPPKAAPPITGVMAPQDPLAERESGLLVLVAVAAALVGVRFGVDKLRVLDEPSLPRALLEKVELEPSWSKVSLKVDGARPSGVVATTTSNAVVLSVAGRQYKPIDWNADFPNGTSYRGWHAITKTSAWRGASEEDGVFWKADDKHPVQSWPLDKPVTVSAIAVALGSDHKLEDNRLEIAGVSSQGVATLCSTSASLHGLLFRELDEPVAITRLEVKPESPVCKVRAIRLLEGVPPSREFVRVPEGVVVDYEVVDGEARYELRFSQEGTFKIEFARGLAPIEVRVTTPPPPPAPPKVEEPKPDAPKPPGEAGVGSPGAGKTDDPKKPEEPKPEAPKTDAPKPEEPKPADAPKTDAPKPDEPKPAEPKPAEPKPAEPKPEAPKPEEPKPADAPKTDAPKPEEPKPEAPKTDAPK